MTWMDLVSLISLRSAARVVDLPEPVAPVTRTRPVFSLDTSAKIGGNLSCARVGNVGVEFAQDDGELAALGENVDAETGLVAQAVGRIAGAVADQILGQARVAVDQIQRDHLGLIGRQFFDGRIKADRDQFAGLLDLQRLVHGEVQVRDIPAAADDRFGLPVQAEHHRQYVIQFAAAHIRLI